MEAKTTIQISRKTWRRLKAEGRLDETYDILLNRLLDGISRRYSNGARGTGRTKTTRSGWIRVPMEEDKDDAYYALIDEFIEHCRKIGFRPGPDMCRHKWQILSPDDVKERYPDDVCF